MTTRDSSGRNPHAERNPHAGTPITDDDATIAAALEDVSIPTLMLSMVHMTGDPSILRGALRPQGLFLNEVQGFMSEEDKAEVRRLALDVIRDYRDRGSEPAAAARPGAHQGDDELARLRRTCRTSTCPCSSRRWSSTAPTRARSTSASDEAARARRSPWS